MSRRVSCEDAPAMLLLLTLHVPLTAALLGCAAPPAQDPPPAPPAPAATRPDSPAAPADVDDLLDRVEQSGRGLRDFSAGISYWKYDSVLDRTEQRQGTVLYQVEQDGNRRFAILLDWVIVGNRRRQRPKHYVFDGSWLAEIDEEQKQFIKRQIVPPGETFDPLRLGEGPFPLPVGQTASDVKARFEVTLRTTPQDEILARQLEGRDVEGVRLVPRPGTTEAKDFAEVEVFYDRKTMLPAGIGVVEVNGDRRTVVLRDPRRNEGVDERKLSVEVPDKAGWMIDIQEWRRP